MTEYRVARPEEQAALTFFGSMVFSMDGEKTDFETLIPKEYAKERSCAEHHLLAVNEQGKSWKTIWALWMATTG